MVDLVKIRKKKAEQKAKAEEESPSRPVAQSPSEAPQQPSNSATQQPEEPRTRGPEEPPAPPGDRVTGQPSKLDHFKQTAGQKRATVQAQETASLPTTHLELLTFVIAGEHYAVDIERIVEIVTPRAVTRIPNAEFSVVGIISLRGTIVTLVDVRRKLRHPAAGEPTADTRIVVIDYEKEMIGFVVDRVLRVVKPGADEIEAHPVVHATELDESIRGVFRVSGALTILLDLDKLLDSRALAST